MSSEYQRILSELAKLQEQILYNEVPSLLLAYTEHTDPSQSISQLITGLLAIQKEEFLVSIAKNIANVMQENAKLKAESQGLKGLIRSQEGEVAVVKESVKELSEQKNSLSLELKDLKAQQVSLGQLINSSSIEMKIKEILKENEYLKGQVQQRDKLIQVKQAQIKQYIQKQAFWTSQIRALENDNSLFHRDLTEANNRIQALTKQNGQMQQSQSQACAQLEFQVKGLKEELGRERQQCGRLRLEAKGLADELKQSEARCEGLRMEGEREKKLGENAREEARFLRECMEKLQQELAALADQQSITANRIQQSYEYNEKLTNQISQLTSSHESQLQRLSSAISQSQQRVNELSLQLSELTETHESLSLEYSQYKVASQREKQEEAIRNEQAIERVQEQCRFAMDKARGQSETAIKQVRDRLDQVNKQKEALEIELKVEKENAEEYKLYNEENNQLRSELERITSLRSNQKSIQNGAYMKKYMFQLLQAREEIQRLKRDSAQLRALVLTLLQGTKKFVIKEINKAVHTVLEMKMYCETCSHWQKYAVSKKTADEGPAKLREVKSSKDLRTLNQKFKLIKEQNEKFGSRIQKIIQE